MPVLVKGSGQGQIKLTLISKEMNPLLEQEYLDKIKECKERAKKYLDAGDYERASEEYLKCSRYCEILIRMTKDESKKMEYYGAFEKFLEASVKVRKIGKTGGREIEKRKDHEGSFDQNEFTQYILSLISKSKVRWDDIGGLDEVKKLMMETIVIAGLKKPESIKPWRGVLLFGPPGTGKTMLAVASAGSLNATFFNVKAEKVLSKYFGESSKLVSSLYSVARERAPSIVFIDEFDALSLSRSGDVSEASRRMLSTLLAELDGFQDKGSDRLVLTLAATNTPWDLDQAILSRFPKRIYVPLPDEKACEEIIKIHTRGLDVSKLDIKGLAGRCVEKLYSGRDIANLCQQAIWNMIRDANPSLHKLAELPYDELRKRSLKMRALEMDDFEAAFRKIKSPLTKKDLERYERWNEEFGSS